MYSHNELKNCHQACKTGFRFYKAKHKAKGGISWNWILRIFSWEFFVSSSVHSKSQESVYYYLVITLWKFEYTLIWVLTKSKLFGSNCLKVSFLCDMYYEKRFYYSLICEELPENHSCQLSRIDQEAPGIGHQLTKLTNRKFILNPKITKILKC